MQAKLLRVIQEQEFERLGATRTLRVNVRLVAATPRNLAEMVDKREFRSDLYYRLHVFPVIVPPLRDRSEDISLLAEHFMREYSSRMNREVESIEPEVMAALMAHQWPGNIRELQNFIERSVILSPGRYLRAPIEELSPAPSGTAETTADAQGLSRLHELERDHILRTLEQCNWVLGGRTGAAARLNVSRTTLISKMHRFGIERPESDTALERPWGACEPVAC